MQFLSPTDLSYNKHIRIRPVARLFIWSPAILSAETDCGHALPSVLNVSCGPPAVSHLGQFRCYTIRSSVGNTIDHAAAGGLQCLVHFFKMIPVNDVPVIFQIIKAPISPLLCIDFRKGVFYMIPVLDMTPLLFRIREPVIRVMHAFFNPPIFSIRIVTSLSEVAAIRLDPRA